MSWLKTSPMEEKKAFIQSWQSGEYTVRDLCRAFNISRTTGHKLIKRFGEEGLSCFIEKSRRPHGHPNKTSVSIENSIISLKQKHKYWGARKIRKLLESSYGHEELPSQTTIHAILKRNGLVKSRKRRGHRLVCVNPKFDPKRCNEIWSADYKGKFKLGNRRYCHALTVCYPEKPPRYDYPNC